MVFSNNSSSSSRNDRLYLIKKILKLILEIDENEEALFSLLQENSDKLDEQFIHCLQEWINNNELKTEDRLALIDLSDFLQDFSEINFAIKAEIEIASYEKGLEIIDRLDDAEDWALIQYNLGNAYRKRVEGERDSNIERAIGYYQKALQVFNDREYPTYWAMTQNNLAITYSDRICGERGDNLERALECYEQALQVYTRQAFPEDWAETQNNLANIYCERIQGEKADNLEQAIEYYRQALQVFTFEEYPEDWALTQNNLGQVFCDRLEGERADNLETAIAFFEDSLQVRTLDKDPEAWALTQNNLGMVYRNRIRGEKASNLERAIGYYSEALQVFNDRDFPEEWALVQNNLAIAYNDRIKGEKAENLERAINCYQRVLQIYTREDFPLAWATAQVNLGEAYRNRIRGETAENVERAIEYYHQALQIYSQESFPIDWAEVQNNLAIAYCERIRGRKAENIEQGIHYYREALKVYSQEQFPVEWALTQSNLATAFYSRLKGDKADNLEQTIFCLEAALQVRTREANPQTWAMTLNNLATAYSDRIKGDKAENLETAINYYQQVLQVRTRETYPVDWAVTQNNLAAAYGNRVLGDREENLKLTRDCYQGVLQVFTRTAFPQDYAATQYNLGLIYFVLAAQASQYLTNSYEAFVTAIETIENLRQEIISGSGMEQDKQKLAEDWNSLYQYMVQVCLKKANSEPEYYRQALEYVERSKARNLVELLANKNLFPKEECYEAREDYQKICDRLNQLRGDIATQQRQLELLINNRDLQQQEGQHREQLQQRLSELQQQQREILGEIDRVDSNFKFSQTVEPISFQQIQSLLNKHTAIVEWYITDSQILAFIVTLHHQFPQVCSCSVENRDALLDFFAQYQQAYTKEKERWQSNLEQQLNQLAEILDLAEILKQIPEECQQLILIPHRLLHLLPLHALPLPEQLNKCLLDRFPEGVRYAPSCQLLQLSQKQQRPNFNRLLAIQDPTDELAYANLEVETILPLFSSVEVLVKEEADEAALKANQTLSQAHCNHFSCHGEFNLESPLESALLLAKDGRLTLAEIFSLSLDRCRLVTLSACETGLSDPNSLSDEYIGLPSGFLYAGSSSVVSSLWKVNDLSTAFLMIKFYQNLHQGSSVAVALNQAQLWLRNVTKMELEGWIKENLLDTSSAVRMYLRRRFYKMSDDALVFGKPIYWVGFCAVGQ